MGLGQLTKVKASRVIGIDASTKSLAFAIFEDGKPIRCGEVFFKGSTVFERLKDARKKIRILASQGILNGDYVVIESAIMVRNIQTAIDLAYVYGAILSELSEVVPNLEKVAPITWQSKIGVPNLKKEEREAIQRDFPGKSKTWYQNKGREIRKQRIADFAAQHFSGSMQWEDSKKTDNVTDAIGIAYYASRYLTR